MQQTKDWQAKREEGQANDHWKEAPHDTQQAWRVDEDWDDAKEHEEAAAEKGWQHQHLRKQCHDNWQEKEGSWQSDKKLGNSKIDPPKRTGAVDQDTFNVDMKSGPKKKNPGRANIVLETPGESTSNRRLSSGKTAKKKVGKKS